MELQRYLALIFAVLLWACGGDEPGSRAGDSGGPGDGDVSAAEAGSDVPGDEAGTTDSGEGDAIEDTGSGDDSSEIEPDDGLADTTEDTAPPPERGATSAAFTGGGGMRESVNYAIRVAFGPSMPVADVSSENFRMIIGPRALHP